MSRNLAVDVGNSTVKCGVFEGTDLLDSIRIEGVTVGEVVSWGKERGASRAIVSMVRGDSASFCDALGGEISTCRLTSRMRQPFESRYKTPETLGGDRIAGMAAAAMLYRGQDVVVVDGGTALTCDYMSGQGVYEGGTISPGVGMRFQALREHTGALPLVGVESYRGMLGRTTAECIAAGVVGGVLSEIAGFLQIIATFATDFRLVLTGGDAELLESSLERPCEVRRELVLEGLNALLRYNVE